MTMYENTVPLDDTVALDSPITESRLLSIDMNTKVLDGCESAQQSGDQNDYFEKDVALDSDDEGENQNESANSVKECCGATGRFSGRDGIGLLRQKQAPAGYFRRLNKVKKHVLGRLDSAISERSDEESAARRIGLCNDRRFQEHPVIVDGVVSRSSEQKPVLMDPVEELLERKLSSYESKYMDMGKDMNYDSKRAELIESPQVSESLDKALRFVDDYLSVCDLGSHKDLPTRKTDMIKSPHYLRANGAQNLARRLTLGSTASKLTTFDWAETQIDEAEYASSRLYKDSVFGFRGDKRGSVTVDQEFPDVKLQNEISNLQPEALLPGNMSNNLDTVWLSSNDSEKVGSNPEMCIVPDSMELDEQLDAGISRQNVENVEQLRLIQDELYIGPDTQMAAEAMEELVHSGPPRVDDCVTQQGSNNLLLDSSNAVNNKSKSNAVSQEVAFVDWRCMKKRSKTMKTSTVQDTSLSKVAAKRANNQRKTVSQPRVGKILTTKKQMAEDFFNDRSESKVNRKIASSSRITVQQEEYGITERCSLKEFQKLDRACSRWADETAGGVKCDPPSKAKNKSNSFHKVSLKKGVKGTCLKSNSGSSFEVVTDNAKAKEKSYLNVANTTLSELNPWVYPKGKRTRVFTPRHTISSSNQRVAFASTENNLKKHPVEEAVGRVAKLLVYNRRRKVSLGREHTGSSLKLAVDFSSPVTDSAVPRRQVKIPIESDANKPLKQIVTTDDASINMKAGLFSERHSAKRKRLSLSPFSRSPLMKELTRLGYTDSLPGFLPKDSRRRRATEKVCVLFSQNMDTSTLKQQKKIAARLGFSIASCSSDATHFVADRFVRTRNMLEAIGLGKHVVTHLWLESCKQAGYNVDEKSYILRDEKKEKEIGFNMHVTLTRASQRPLLKGRRVLITPNVKPGEDVINSLVKAVHGDVVQSISNAKTKDKLIHNDVLILSSVEDYTICLQYLQIGASIYDSELLLNGIVTQELEYERYKLFKDRKENGH